MRRGEGQQPGFPALRPATTPTTRPLIDRFQSSSSGDARLSKYDAWHSVRTDRQVGHGGSELFDVAAGDGLDLVDLPGRFRGRRDGPYPWSHREDLYTITTFFATSFERAMISTGNRHMGAPTPDSGLLWLP